MGKNKIKIRDNYKFLDSSILNDMTFIDYLNRFRKVALSMFEWVNLPKSMDAIFLEKTLYYYGQATLLFDENYGYINTRCSNNGYVNLYELPTELNCYAYNYQQIRKLYSGIENSTENTNECILVRNDWDMTPTDNAMGLFAYRLYLRERTADVNINAQKTPVLITVDEKQRIMMENLYSQYNGNRPFIFGDKQQMGKDALQAISTEAPFIADKIMQDKKEIWNEALTYLGINNIMVDKKERLIQDEANSNNELINLNLQSFLAPRQIACEEFNTLFGLKGTDKEIKVRLRSDLHNIIKNAMSNTNDFNNDNEIDEEVEENE